MLVEVNAAGVPVVALVGSDSFRPSRVNAAGRCLYCSAPGCVSEKCEETHAESTWGVCDDCAGLGCGECTFGVIEVYPVEAVRRAADVARLGYDGAAVEAKARRRAFRRAEVEVMASDVAVVLGAEFVW